MHFVYSALSVFKSPFQTAWFWPGASVCVAAMCLLPCASCVSSCVFHIPESVVFACHRICRKRQTFAFSKQKPGSRSVLSILSLLCLWSQHWQSFTAGILLRNDDHISCKTFMFICKAYSSSRWKSLLLDEAYYSVIRFRCVARRLSSPESNSGFTPWPTTLRALSSPDSVSKAVLSICQFISLSVYLCLCLCVCLFGLSVCLCVRLDVCLVCLSPSVAWASVALHEMNALFPPRF